MAISNVSPITNNVLSVGASAPGVPPGWQFKWAPPPESPRLFCPPGFTVDLAMLRRALEADSVDTKALGTGDSGAWATLMVELLRQAHRDPKERNILMSPKSADMVTVYGPGRWEQMPFRDAVRILYKYVAGEIAGPIAYVNPQLQGLPGFHAEDAVSASRRAVVAHLENLATQMQSGADESWLGELTNPRPGGICWSVFGKERYQHLPPEKLAMELEAALNVYREEDFDGADMTECAHRALMAIGRQFIHRHPENLTVGPLLGSEVLVWRHGWEAKPAAEAARQQVEALLELLALFFETPQARPFTPLARHLEQTRAEIIAAEVEKQELLTQYAKEEERYCASGGHIRPYPLAPLHDKLLTALVPARGPQESHAPYDAIEALLAEILD